MCFRITWDDRRLLGCTTDAAGSIPGDIWTEKTRGRLFTKSQLIINIPSKLCCELLHSHLGLDASCGGVSIWSKKHAPDAQESLETCPKAFSWSRIMLQTPETVLSTSWMHLNTAAFVHDSNKQNCHAPLVGQMPRLPCCPMLAIAEIRDREISFLSHQTF